MIIALNTRELGDFFPGSMAAELQSLPTTVDLVDTDRLSPTEWRRRLEAGAPEILVTGWSTPPLPPVVPRMLRYVCVLTGSVRALVTRQQIENGLLVTNWGDAISRTVAEGALLHILACLRRATHATMLMHNEGGWNQGRPTTASLFQRKVGLHGFGNIARELVRLLMPFNVDLSTFDPGLDTSVAASFGVRPVASLEALFGENDVVVELAPLLPDTHGCVTEQQLRLIRDGGVFVNVGRGAVVDEAALARVAAEGRILVGLDVFATEPLPASSPLRGLPNVFLTPHEAGPTPDRRRDAGAFALANLRAYREGRELQAVVTPERFDTMT